MNTQKQELIRSLRSGGQTTRAVMDNTIQVTVFKRYTYDVTLLENPKITWFTVVAAIAICLFGGWLLYPSLLAGVFNLLLLQAATPFLVFMRIKRAQKQAPVDD